MKKYGELPGKGNLNSKLYKSTRDSFQERVVVLLITFI